MASLFVAIFAPLLSEIYALKWKSQRGDLLFYLHFVHTIQPSPGTITKAQQKNTIVKKRSWLNFQLAEKSLVRQMT